MNADAHDVLDEQRRCLLAFASPTGPLLAPMAYWSDGEHLWLTTSRSAPKVRRLREDGRCALYVPGAPGGPGVSGTGRVRVFRAGDPVGLLLHGPALTGAMAALAVSNVSSLFGYAQDAALVPTRWAPQNRVALRLTIDEVELVEPPVAPAGVAPALPSTVPSDVRRALAGRRDVTVAVDRPGLEVLPASWGAAYRLTAPAGRSFAPGARAAVVVDRDPESRPTTVVGLSLRGEIDGSGALRPARATWWKGFRMSTADVPTPPTSLGGPSGIVLPD